MLIPSGARLFSSRYTSIGFLGPCLVGDVIELSAGCGDEVLDCEDGSSGDTQELHPAWGKYGVDAVGAVFVGVGDSSCSCWS